MSAPSAQVPPLIAEALGCSPAPLGWRVLALVIDLLIAGIAAGLILTRVVLPQEIPDAADVATNQWQLIWAASEQAAAGKPASIPQPTPEFVNLIEITVQTIFLTLFGYFAGCELGGQGSTLGKRVFRLRVAQWGTGEPPRPLETLIRAMVKTASLIAWLAVSLFGIPILLLNVVPVAFNRTRRAGHDLMARTIVTGDPLPPPAPEPPPHFDEE
jgi:uncharacterized RDD family membrane protein YckC